MTGPFVAPDITFRWEPSPGKVDFYVVTIAGRNNISGQPNMPEITLGNFKAGTTYTIRISAFSNNKHSKDYLEEEFRTDTAGW